MTVLLKAMFSRSVRLNMMLSWKTKPTCWCSGFFVVVVDAAGRRTRRVPDVGLEQPGEQVEQLRLAGRGRADDGGSACRP